MTRKFLLSALAGASALGFLASTAWPQSQDMGGGFVKHGIGAEASRACGGLIVEDGRGQPKLLLGIQDHHGASGLAMIDPDTGETAFHALPMETGKAPFAFLYSRRGYFYMMFGGHFLEFDPRAGEYTYVSKPLWLSEDEDYRDPSLHESTPAMCLTEDDNGVIWAGTFPKAHLVSFDPKARKYTDYGPVNEENWNQYPRLIATDSAGWVYAHVGFARNHIIALNPKTGEVRPMVKEQDRIGGGVGANEEHGNLWRGQDGNVYGRMPKGGPWQRMHAGEVKETLKGEPDVAAVAEKSGSQGAILGELPDGRRVRVDMSERKILVLGKGETTQATFDYPSRGARIHSLTLGPDGRIYGATGHPGHFFAYNPKTDSLSHRPSGGGHINAMTAQADKLYGAKYTQGILIEYDPGADDELTFQELARGGETLLRPFTILALSDDRHVIQAGGPGYGLAGGGMMVYDVETEDTDLYEHTQLIENHTTSALVELPDGNLIGGTTIAPGTGGETVAEDCELYIMEWPSLDVVYREPILPGSRAIRDLMVAEDGLVYGLASEDIFFAFDPVSRKVLHTESFGEMYGGITGSQAPRVCALGPDGNIYTLFKKAIVRMEPGTFEHKEIAKPPVDVNVGVALLDGRLYFASGADLWSYAIPELSGGE